MLLHPPTGWNLFSFYIPPPTLPPNDYKEHFSFSHCELFDIVGGCVSACINTDVCVHRGVLSCVHTVRTCILNAVVANTNPTMSNNMMWIIFVVNNSIPKIYSSEITQQHNCQIITVILFIINWIQPKKYYY